MDSIVSLFNKIARSHAYWGRKPLVGLGDALRHLEAGNVLLDPFCGGGTSVIAALRHKARVIATDLNPMSIFLTRVLIRPVSIPNIEEAFRQVRVNVANRILDRYATKCPKCGNLAYIECMVWSGDGHQRRPELFSTRCSKCGPHKLCKPSRGTAQEQIKALTVKPKKWYPHTIIHGKRKAPVQKHAQLFTGRNLAALADLLHVIESINSEVSREALKYVFTAMLYSCSEMQMFSDRTPSSSRGWYALRYYIPPKRKEKNVWRTFEDRYQKFIACKKAMNRALPSVRVTDSFTEFMKDDCEVLLRQADVFSLSPKLTRAATHIFLDPPYVEDLEYFAFSEFWGSWLKMEFDYAREWEAKSKSIDSLIRLLTLLNRTTKSEAKLILAYGSKNRNIDNIKELAGKSGYNVERSGVFFFDNSQKRDQNGRQQDRFFVMSKGTHAVLETVESPIAPVIDEEQWILFFLRVAAFRWSVNSLESIIQKTARFIPASLRRTLNKISKEKISNILKSEEKCTNQKAYQTLCCHLITKILTKDGWYLEYANRLQIGETSLLDLPCPTEKRCPDNRLHGAAFILSYNHSEKRIVFCFDSQPKRNLKRISRVVKKIDAGKYRYICVLIVDSAKRMREVRRYEYASTWPRGFFLSFTELINLYNKVGNSSNSSIFSSLTETIHKEQKNDVIGFEGTIVNNIQVGGTDSNYRKLWFRAKQLQDIVPGQFIMLNTRPRERISPVKPTNFIDVRSGFNLQHKAYLKRPFGIHRAFYKNFGRDYLRHLSLPSNLSRILHTVQPHEFDIFFKVLPNGIGTKELAQLKHGDKIEMIGPLGKRFDLRDLRDRGVQEIHVVGGGVGMAPLIFLVQALRFFAFRIIAFLGIERFGVLQHEDPMAESYVADIKDSKVYIDDLLAAGIKKSDIYVSLDTNDTNIPHTVKNENIHCGFVSEQYEKYLINLTGKTPNSIQVFSCGPLQMMKAVYQITSKQGVPLKVFLEKRMACGFGVCLSCVCKTKINGSYRYSRVCTDGPVFDADKILW